MNESLERIGTSLQKLIEEAQASLVNPQQSNNEDDTITERNKTSSLSDYSYQYIQNRYIQSQEKLGLALDQLEKSIQYIPTMIMTKEDHYYHHHHTPSHNNEPAKTPKRPFKIPWATLGLVIVLLVYSLQRPKSTTKYQHIHVSLLLLLISSFYRRVRLKHHIINPIDYCILRLNLSKGTPAICGFIHRLNLVLCLLLHK
jgi:hypothetical protein